MQRLCRTLTTMIKLTLPLFFAITMRKLNGIALYMIEDYTQEFNTYMCVCVCVKEKYKVFKRETRKSLNRKLHV